MNTYRKFQNGCEFLMVTDTHLLSVLKTKRGDYRIMATSNPIMIADAKDSLISMESSKEEFDKNFYDASVYIAKINSHA